jgi:hypothetical protein
MRNHFAGLDQDNMAAVLAYFLPPVPAKRFDCLAPA